MGYKKQDSSSIKNTFMHPFSKLSVQSIGGRGLWLQGGEGVGRDPSHTDIYIMPPAIHIYKVYPHPRGVSCFSLYRGDRSLSPPPKKNFAV